MEDVYKYLQRISSDLKEGMEFKDPKIMKLYSLYKFHYNCPGDPCGQALLKEGIMNYILSRRDRIGAWPASAPLSLRKYGRL